MVYKPSSTIGEIRGGLFIHLVR